MIQESFSKAGATYDTYAQPQRWAAGHLATKIPDCSPAHIVELGCGTGLLTEHLQARFSESAITAVDAAEGMIDQARQRKTLQSVDWVIQDLLSFDVPAETHLLVSACTFHWLEDLPGFLSKLRKSVPPKTPLVFSAMLKGTVAELRDVRRKVLPDHQVPEELPSLSDITEYCTSAGWSVDDQEELPYCARFTTAHELLRSLQRTGVNGGRYGSKGQPLYRGDLKQLMDELNRIYGQHSDGIPLHYQVGFMACHA